MLSKEKQKAIIEAMLFVSTEPVSLNKIVRRLKSVSRKEYDQEGQSVETETAEELQSDLVEAASEAFDPADTGSVERISVLEDLTAQDEDNQDEDQESENEDESNDVLKQLMQKQQELDDEITNSDVKALLLEIEESYKNEDRGIELVTVAKGYQLRTKYEMLEYLKNEKVQTPSRFSPSSLETLAIVAYQQPITRNKIEEIRGVDSGGVMKTLLDKGILRVVGRSEEAGKSLIYGTSSRFLEVFGLNSLKDLPSLQDYHSLQLSQDREGIDEEKNQDQKIGISDLVEEDYEALSEAERAILDDLNDTIKDLRDVEKHVLISTGIKQADNQAEDETQTEVSEIESSDEVQDARLIETGNQEADDASEPQPSA